MKRAAFFWLLGISVFFSLFCFGSSALQYAQKTVIIDAGHGEPDGGTSSRSGITEQSLNLSIALKTKAFLDFVGIRSIMTRYDENSIHSPGARTIREKKISDMKNRLYIAELTENPVFLSIHMNYFSESAYRGAQVFYSKNHEDSKMLAHMLQNNLRNIADPNNKREVKAASNDVYLLKMLKCPSVIAECGFLSNDDEAALLLKDAYQSKIAFALTMGLLEYLNTTKDTVP